MGIISEILSVKEERGQIGWALYSILYLILLIAFLVFIPFNILTTPIGLLIAFTGYVWSGYIYLMGWNMDYPRTKNRDAINGKLFEKEKKEPIKPVKLEETINGIFTEDKNTR